MDAVEIDIPFEYSCYATIKGSRTPAWRWVRETMPASVRAVGRDEVDAFVAIAGDGLHQSLSSLAYNPTRGLPFEGFPVVAGRLMRPVSRSTFSGKPHAMGREAYAGFLADFGTKRCLGLQPNPFEVANAGHVVAELREGDNRLDATPSSNLRDVLHTNRDRVVADATADLADLAFVEGALCSGRGEPIVLRRQGGPASLAWLEPRDLFLSGAGEHAREAWRLDKALDRFGPEGHPMADAVPFLADLRADDFTLGLADCLARTLACIHGDGSVLARHDPADWAIQAEIDEVAFRLRETLRGISACVRGTVATYDRHDAMDVLTQAHARLTSLPPWRVAKGVDVEARLGDVLFPVRRWDDFERDWSRPVAPAAEDEAALAAFSHG